MSQWSEKIPKENLSETVSSTRYFFGSFKIQINNFRKSFKKFIIDLLTRNVALNLSGAIFFVGLGYSLKWWYKDQLFVILVKQNLPALSESQQNVSWETGEAILNGEYQTWTPLIDRIDLYANHVRVKFKQPWQKHVYERFLGVFGESAQINVCKQVLTTKDWWKETNSVSNNSSPGEQKKHISLPYNANPTSSELLTSPSTPLGCPLLCVQSKEKMSVPFQGKSSFGTRTKFSFLPRTNGLAGLSFVNIEDVSFPCEGKDADVSFANRTPFYLSPLNMENSEEIESKERNNFSDRVYDSKKVINYVNKFSTYTPEKPIFSKRWFKLSPRNLCYLNLDDTLHSFSTRTKFSFLPCINGLANSFQRRDSSYALMNLLGTQSHLSNNSVKQRKGIHKKPETAIKFSYPLQLTKKLTGWQPSPNLLLLSSYRDEIPYKLENTFQSYFPKKDSQLLFLSTSFREAILLPTTSLLQTSLIINPCLSNINNAFDSNYTPQFLLKPRKELRPINGVNTSHNENRPFPLASLTSLPSKFILAEEPKEMLVHPKESSASPPYSVKLRWYSKEENNYSEIRIINCKNSQFLDLSTKLIDWETQLCQYILKGDISKKENNEAKQLGEKDLFKETTHKISFNKFLLPTKQTETDLKQSHLLETKKLLQNQLASLCKVFPINFVEKSGDIVKDSSAEMNCYTQEQISSLPSKGLAKQRESIDSVNIEDVTKGLAQLSKLDNKSNVFVTSEIGNESNIFETNDHNLVNVTKKILTVKTNQQKGPKGAPLFANSTIVNDAQAVKREGFIDEVNRLDPLLLLNTLGFTFNHFSPLTNPPILLANTKLVTPFASLGLANLFKSGVNITSITPHQKSFTYISSLQSKGHPIAEQGVEGDVKEGKLLTSKMSVPPVQRKGLRSRGVTESNMKRYKPLFNFLSQRLCIANAIGITDTVGIPSAPKEAKSAKGLLYKSKICNSRECDQEKYVSFYFNPKNLNWVIFQQSTNCKFNSLLKKIAGERNQLVTTQSTHLMFEFLKKRGGLSSLPSFASPVGLSKQPKTKGAFTPPDCSAEMNDVSSLQGKGHPIAEQGVEGDVNSGKMNSLPSKEKEPKKGKEAALFTGLITSNEPIIIGFEETESIINADALVPQDIPSEAKELEAESLYKSYQSETGVLQNFLPLHLLNSARQKLTLLRGLRNFTPSGLEVDRFTTISNINKINLKLKETKFETLNSINVVDKGINFDQNSRYMSGYVYPDIQSHFLKARLDQWFAKNNNFFKFNSFAPTKFQRNEMVGILDKACLSDFLGVRSQQSKEILSQKIKPTTFASLHTPSVTSSMLVHPKESYDKSSICTASPSLFRARGEYSKKEVQDEVLHSLQSKGHPLAEQGVEVDVKEGKLCKPLANSLVHKRAFTPTDCFVSEGMPTVSVMPSKAKASVKETEINLLPLKNIGNIEVPYKKFNHYLAKFPGFSDPNQFFTTLPQISCGNENLVNKFQGFACDIAQRERACEAEEQISSLQDKGQLVRMVSKPRGVERDVKEGMPTVSVMPSEAKASARQSRELVTKYADLSYLTSASAASLSTEEAKQEGVQKAIDKSEINKLFIQKNGCNFRKVAYSGIVVQRNKWTKDFQPFKDSKKLLDGASQSSIWGTLFLGPENPLTNRQCHFFGQKQLSTLDTNSLQRDYLRQLGKEILTQSNSKGYTELSKFSSIERTKILSLSKKVNSFFFKKRKYSYLLQPKDQWHLLFQEQLCTALEDGKKYPSSTIRSFEETNTALRPKEEKSPNFKDSFGSGRIKVSAPLVMSRFPKKLVQYDKVCLDKSPQPRKSVPSRNAKGSVLLSQGFERARNDNYLFQQVSSKPRAIHTDSFASLGMYQLPSYRLEQGISWRPFCHLQRSYLLNDALLTSLPCKFISAEDTKQMLTKECKVSTSNISSFLLYPEGVSTNIEDVTIAEQGVEGDVKEGKLCKPFLAKQRTGVKINSCFNESNQNKLSELGEGFANSITSNETNELGYRQLERTNGVFANPLEVVISMSPYFSYLPSASFPSCFTFFDNICFAQLRKPSGNIYTSSMSDVGASAKQIEGKDVSEAKKKSTLTSASTPLGLRSCPLLCKEEMLAKQAVGVKAPTLSVYPERLLLQYAKGLLSTRRQELRGDESSQSLKLIYHYPLFTERFTEEINTVPYLNKNSLFYLATSFPSFVNIEDVSKAKDSYASPEGSAKQSVGVKAPSKFILTEGLRSIPSDGVHKSRDSVTFADSHAALAEGKLLQIEDLYSKPISAMQKAEHRVQRKGSAKQEKKAKPSMKSLLGLQNICTSLLIQEPSVSSCFAQPWAVLNQWIFLIALLFWIEQTLLDNVFPALFALEQILLSAAGIKTGGNNRSDGLRISKNETPKFQNLAGIDGLLGELSELVLFLRGQRNLGVAKLSLWNNSDSSTKMNSLGMPLNKKTSYGVLLTGSPGTGKTFLVRALANEANVPVLILSASTLTTSKLNNNKPSWSIRHAFKRAKELAPCILFIDEIDALGKSRGKIVTDINEIVADINVTSAPSLGHKRMFTSVSNSFANPSFGQGRAQLMFSYEQFGQNCSNFTATLLNKWEYPLQSTILQESNKINQNSLCQEKLVDLLKIASPGLGKLSGIRSTKLNDVQDPSRKGSELIDSSRSKKESTTDFSDDLSYPKGLSSEAQQQLPTREKEITRGKFGPLTQLLVSMDGVSSFSGVLIMGATNRPELLDPALTRPGRFEKIIRIDKPSEQNRIEILQLYSQNLGVHQQIPWSYLATRTIGLTTADLAVAMNYSSLRAIIQGSAHTLETIEYGLNCITRL